MRKTFFAGVAVLMLSTVAIPQAQAGFGACVFGSAVGAYFGHKIHHTFAGAAGGCSAGIMIMGAYNHWKAGWISQHPGEKPPTLWGWIDEHKDELKAKLSGAQMLSDGN